VDCELAANLISARTDGELAAGEDAALDGHLAECAACRAAMEAAATQDAAMVRAFATERNAAAALARRVEREIESFSSPRETSRRNVKRWAGWMAAAAAGFVAGVIYMRPANTPTTTTPLQVSVQPADPIAHLALISGEVFTCPSDKKDWQPVAAGDALAPGAKLRTADAAKCEVALPGGSRLRLNSGTELKLAAGGDVQLTGGQIWSAVPPNAGPLRIAAGDTQVTTPSAQLDVACDANAATVTVVAGSAQVNGQGQATTTVRGGEMLRVGGEPPPKYGCVPMEDPIKAARWLDDLLVLLPPDDPELLARVDALLTRIVAERSSTAAANGPGPVEHDVRARGRAWAAAMGRYAIDHRFGAAAAADADADRAKRRTAARLLADLAPPSSVPDLIAMLADDDNEVRYHAAAALNRLTGQTLGFSPDRCAAEPRDAAPVAAWQEWWAQNRSRYPERS
jgi:ferric-dicitrate binding protein FerR (iron transport regulator)